MKDLNYNIGRMKKDKWSKKYNLDACIECGRSDIPHHGQGLCRNCHSQKCKQSLAYKKWYEKYKQSGKRKECYQRWEQSDKGKETIRKYKRKYNRTEKRKACCQKWEQSDKGKESRRRYRQSPKAKEHRKEYMKEWHQSYMRKPEVKENYRNHCRKRRAIKAELNYWLPFYDMIWMWAKELTFGYCPNCGEFFDNGIHKLTQDHIIPISKGGIHSIENVQPMCARCNESKGNQTYIWYQT